MKNAISCACCADLENVAFTVPILMKKGRPGQLLQVLAPSTAVDALSRIIFLETTTIGILTTRVRPTSGTALVGGANVSTQSELELRRTARSRPLGGTVAVMRQRTGTVPD